MAGGVGGDALRPNLEHLVVVIGLYKTAATAVRSLLPKQNKAKAKAKAKAEPKASA